MLEAMPAGILPALSSGMGVTEAAAGQTVTVYAIGSLASAIPIIGASVGWPRRRLLVIALAGHVVTSLVVAISPAFALTLIACFAPGIFAGVLWRILAGCASRLVDPEQRGRGVHHRPGRHPDCPRFGNTRGRTPRRSLAARRHGFPAPLQIKGRS